MTTTTELAAGNPHAAGADHCVPLPSPAELRAELPLPARLAAAVERGRDEIRAVLNGVDDRLLVIAGPCSIHDPEAGLDYARRLAAAARQHSSDLLVVMRTYFEKPRTTVGWKGLINDPHLDGSHDIAAGLRTARRFLLDVADLGLPVATEFLEPVSTLYLSDLVGWGAIGARTTESQIHRQLVSGLPMPAGFKNGTDGGLQVALDACTAAAAAQTFLGMDQQGRASLLATAGNPDTHLILRGGSAGPNYDPEHIAAASARLAAAGLNPRLIVDASHGNSGKSHHRQAEVAVELAARLEAGGPGAEAISGVMLESFLMPGAQKLELPAAGVRADQPAPGLVYGQSVTDACMDWEMTAGVLEQLARGARTRSGGHPLVRRTALG
ncbi:3-deoxy-7-phosphoheptulonate synthase [Arthrobacter sp. I2-34]|uniref:Phospho-2-dehydro-3-deoxyheptonate aldolase n=1 Tax=Arthrobacter hankyongi TaxID=2904801 RepID=A0ABS9LA47_9MICC|nr:3-deoxy-7-phosphoheptulonate synthase [Arthrobacter hankyongi]MCG2623510.1 3-deoxy-7-phosphoheptulonate synthase [Arthrobacter hankyongi]